MTANPPVDPPQPEPREAGRAPVTGNRELDEMIALLYDDLRQTARRERRRAGRPFTVNTTAMINETYLKLFNKKHWNSTEHFMAVAATAMRHVLIDAARARLAQKRGDGAKRVDLDAAEEISIGTEDVEMVRLGDALESLAKIDPELAKLVECRFFAGLDEVETGKILGVSERTVRRRWVQARAFLHREISET